MSHKIETVFGGIAVLFAVAIAALAMFSLASQPAAKSGGKITNERTALAAIAEVRKEDANDRAKACFNTAAKIGASGKFDVLSPVYQTGLEHCGADKAVARGQAAWSAGWRAGAEEDLKPFERSYDSWRRKTDAS